MAKDTSQNPYASQDKYLIAEQAGMRLVVTGILVALFMGLITRAVIAPDRVRAQIERAAASIHKDLHVQFKQAEVSLTDGFFPRFVVVISDVQMDSAEECWMTPRLEVDQIRLPLSIWGLVTNQGIVRQVQADNVKLVLRGEYRACNAQALQAANSPGEKELHQPTVNFKSPLATKTPVGPLVQLQESENKTEAANSIRRISFAKLEIEYNKDPRYRAEFRDVNLEVKNYSPRWMILSAQTQLFKDEQVGDYLSHANVHVEYKDMPEANLKAHFFGNWREGHYSVVGNYQVGDQALVLETDLKHIPLSQVVAILQKYELADSRINAKNMWVSLRSHYAGPLPKILLAPMDVSNVQIDGDQIDISVDRINFRSLQPVKYDPIRLDVQKLNIDSLVNFFNRTSPTRVLAHLGTFTGQAEIRTDQDIHLLGDYSGLEFIFANLGQRELQTIERMRSEASFQNNQWKVHLSEIKPRQGVFNGEMRLVADRSFSEIDLNFAADEILLAPNVQRLMTQGGMIGPMSSQLDLHLRSGAIKGFKAAFKVPSLNVEGVAISNAKARFDFVRDEVQMNLQVANLKLAANSGAFRLMAPLLRPSGQVAPSTAREISFSNVNGQVRTADFKSLGWKNFSADLAEGGKIQTEGAWDEQGLLRGEVHVRASRVSQKWLIQGSRAVPAFVLPEVRR